MLYLVSILLPVGLATAWAIRRDPPAFGRAVLSLARSMDTSTTWVVARRHRR